MYFNKGLLLYYLSSNHYNTNTTGRETISSGLNESVYIYNTNLKEKQNKME